MIKRQLSFIIIPYISEKLKLEGFFSYKELRHEEIKISLFALLIILASCKSSEIKQDEWDSKQGYVPDCTTAVQIAQVIFVRVYGDKVLIKKHFKTILTNKGVWIVEGSLEAGEDGGVPHIEIQKADGKIVNLYHSK